MSWESSSYTKAGAALLAESLSGGAVTITRAVSGTGTAKTDLSAAVSVSGSTHELKLLGIEAVEDGDDPAWKLSIQITGADDAYIMHQVGVYGYLDDGPEETLLLLMQDERGIEVPAASTSTDFEIELDVLLAFSGRADISVTVDSKISAIMRMVRKVIQEQCVQLSTCSLTLATSGWTASSLPGYPYQYTAALSGARASDVPIAEPELDSLATATAADMAGVCETADGSVTFWAENLPAGDIRMQVTLLGQPRADASADTTSALGRATLGKLILGRD